MNIGWRTKTMNNRGASYEDMKRTPMNLNTLDLTDQVQALFPSELKTYPDNQNKVNQLSPRDYGSYQKRVRRWLRKAKAQLDGYEFSSDQVR
jgi:hypothetical protein